MQIKMMGLWLFLATLTATTFAQTTVTTTGGTVNQVPLFTGTSTLGNSLFFQATSTPPGTATSIPTMFTAGRVYISTPGSVLTMRGLANTSWTYDIRNDLVNALTIQSEAPSSAPFAVDFAGNVGVGTTSPEANLEVNSVIKLTNSGSSDGGDGNDGKIGAGTFGPGLNLVGIATQPGTYRKFSLWGEITQQQNNGTNTWIGTNYFSGNVGIGTTNPQAKLEVNGNLRFTADGSVQTTAWTGVLCGGDYAEAVDASGDRKHYEPGDVLVLAAGQNGNVDKSSDPYSTLVAGIYATKPGVIGRRESLSKSADELPMAMIGIVPTKVIAENGAIHQGDLLVTSSTAGYAMRGTDRSRMLGAVIGKAMGSLDSGTGVIEVLVTLQ